MVMCKRPDAVMGPKKKLAVSLLLVLTVALDILPLFVVMTLQPEMMMFTRGGPGEQLGGPAGLEALINLDSALSNVGTASGTAVGNTTVVAVNTSSIAGEIEAASNVEQCEGGDVSIKAMEVILRDAFPPSDSLPSFNVAMNLIGCFNAGGTILSNLILAPMSDKYGRIPFLLISLIGGAGAYVAMFFVATAGESYWGFCFCMFVSGAFAGTPALVNTYFTDLYKKEDDRNKWSSLVLLQVILLASVGALLADPFKKVSLFAGCWVGVGCEMVGFFIVLFYVPETHKHETKGELTADGLDKGAAAATDKKPAEGDGPQEKEAKEKEMQEKAKLAKEKAHAAKMGKKIKKPKPKKEPTPEEKAAAEAEQASNLKKLYWVIAGSIVDSLGSNGFTYALQTIMIIRFPCLISSYTTLMAVIIVAFLIGASIGEPIMSNFGYGFSTFLGNITAVGFQITLAYATGDTFFVAMIFVGNMFSVQSMLTTNPMIMKLAPQDQLGTWLGYNASIESGTQQFGPMFLALIYEAMESASDKETASRDILLFTAAISFLSTLMAIPTVLWFPPEKKAKVSPVPDINDYVIPEDGQVSNVPAAVLDQINEKRIKEGLMPLTLRYGSYADDVENDLLDEIFKQGHDDMIYAISEIKKFTQKMKHDPEEAEKEIEMWVGALKQWVQRPAEVAQAERTDLANWLCDYLEDAGYQMYASSPAFFKAVFMNTFPPLGRFELLPAGEKRNEAIREFMHRFDDFVHMHIKMEKTSHSLTSLAVSRMEFGGGAVSRRPGAF